MDREKFIDEISICSIPDLELIYKTQKDLYSAEELDIISEVLEQKKLEYKKFVSEQRFAETLFCIVALLAPTSALIVGVIMLFSRSSVYKSIGKKTLLVVFISVLIRVFIYSGGFKI
ncbi:MAG: hypothetical protein K2N49_07325 [Ruminococcus sp.]|nr:hypothetical protein [Ruminococcus sp.]MDE7226648.1 hypothetical protein [Ruminococcus sp.]